MSTKGAVRSTAAALAVGSGSVGGRPRKRLPAVVDSPKSPYAAGPLRATTDTERSRVEALVCKHPEFARLGHEPLKQIAATYLDDHDLALRGELRGAGVRIGYRRPQSDDVNPPWSDEAGFVSPNFLLFAIGSIVAAVGIFSPPTTDSVAGLFGALCLIGGAAMIGLSFGEGDDTTGDYR